MNILDAARRSVRHYPGGVDAVASRLGKSPSTLEKELRAAPGYKLGAIDAAEIAAMCREVGAEHYEAYPTAVADTVGAELHFLPRLGDEQSLTHLRAAEVMRECADVVSCAAMADADQVVTDNELREFEQQLGELVRAGQQLRRHMHARNAAAKARKP